MSMNVILIKKGNITLPNGQIQKHSEKFEGIIQTRTEESRRIISYENVIKQLEEYKQCVWSRFETDNERKMHFHNIDVWFMQAFKEGYSAEFQMV